MTVRVLVTGGRDYADAGRVFFVLDSALRAFGRQLVIVHGDARGADRLARRWCAARGVPDERHPAPWDRYGRRAGSIRNGWMLDTGVDLVIAFPGGRGTQDMVVRSRQGGVFVLDLRATLGRGRGPAA